MVKRTDVKVPVKQDGKTKRTLEGEITAFRAWLSKHQEHKPADKTLLNYQKFFVTLTTTYGLDIENPNPLAVCDSVKQVSTSPYTKRQYLNTLKHYLKYRGVEITEDLKQGLKAQRGEKKKKLHPKDLITEEDLRDIILHTTSPMLRAYYTMLWDTGARPSELANLNVEHIREDKYGFEIIIPKSKTAQGKRPVRLLSPLAIEQVGVWWKIHPRRNETDAPFFINKLDRRLSVHPVLNNLRNQHNERLGRGTGKGKQSLNLYLFRKSAATRLLRDKILQPHQVKTRLGHEKHSMMLEQYYAILDEEDQAKAELEAMGIFEGEEKTEETFVKCPNCGVNNDRENAHCFRCKFPLTEEAIQEHVSLEEQVATLQQTILKMGQAVVDITNHLAFMPEDELREAMDKTRDFTSLLTLVRVQDMLRRNESKVELQKRIDEFNVEQEKEGKTKVSIAMFEEFVAGAPKIELQQVLQNAPAIMDLINEDYEKTRKKTPEKQSKKKK